MLYVLTVYPESNVIFQFIKYLQLLSARLVKLTKSAQCQTRVTCIKWQQYKHCYGPFTQRNLTERESDVN